MLENNDKTIEILPKEELEEFLKERTRQELIVPFSTLEDAVKIFEAMGCGYQYIKIVSYYSIAQKGFVLIPENGTFGIELKEENKKLKGKYQ